MDTSAPEPYAPVVIKLLQGIVYYDDTEAWELLLRKETAVRGYLNKMGLQLHLDEVDGYAYLLQPEQTEDEETSLPRLVPRMPLSYGATLLCVLLRERLEEHYASGELETRCTVAREELHEMLGLFYEEHTDEMRREREFDRYINQVERLEFIRRRSGLKEGHYEVTPVLRSKVSADELVEIKNKLKVHADTNA